MLAAGATVVQASANLADWLGVAAHRALGRRLADIWPDAAELLEARAPQLDEEVHELLGETSTPCAGRVTLLAHRTGPYQILEFEPGDARAHAIDLVYPSARSVLERFQTASSVPELCAVAVDEIKRVTGFGRVLAYCFDPVDEHGTVLAEQAEPGYPSYAGQRFPSSDIPAQARALYVRNRIRLIQDADYVPVPLVPDMPVGGCEPLDMSQVQLRSVSPVHVRYMKNMGTLASMSMSLVVGGRLWGLISCHHGSARPVSLRVRTACDLIAALLSLQIDAREQHAAVALRYHQRRDISTMLTSMVEHDGITAGLREVPEAFISFVHADGAAVVKAERCALHGATPTQEQVLALCQWLDTRQHTSDVFHTDSVARDVPQLPELAQRCAGVMAVPISSLHSHYLLWFRREHLHVIEWAGAPHDKRDPTSGALSPRHSFAAWRQKVHNTAIRWRELEIEAARELRNEVLRLVLRKAEETAALAADLAETNKELEAFSYSVSHDLRAPLRHIAGFAELLGDMEGGRLSERGRHFLGNIRESAQHAGTLVDDLLNFSQMGRAALRYSRVDVARLIAEVRREMEPELSGRNIEWHVQDEMPSLVADAAFMRLVLHNLIGNAVKYSRDRDPARIEITAAVQDGGVRVDVGDNGVGFEMAYADKLFGIFQRLHRMEDYEGTGIGLASVRRVIERHNGKVWAHGELERGATFSFWLPTPGAA